LSSTQRRSSDTVGIKLFRLDYDKVISELKSYARRNVSSGAKAVILIGSLARGDYTAFSDADVVIVVERASKGIVDRVSEYIDPSLSVDIEPRVYTVDELRKMALEKRRIVKKIIEHGKLLAVDESIVEMLRKEYYG